MKKIILVLICVLLLPITVVASEEEREIRMQYGGFQDIEAMTDRSSDIVQLEILDERVEWINIWEGHDISSERDPYELHTIHRARVLNVFKGNLEIGEVIEVMQMGGELDGTNWINNSAANFSYGDEVVLFLHDPINFPFTIINPYQGVYFISDDGELLSYHDHPFVDSELTQDILEQIQYDNGIEPRLVDEDSNEDSSIEKIIIVAVGIISAFILAILILRNRNRKKINETLKDETIVKNSK